MEDILLDKKKRLIIIGAGGFGHEVLEWLKDSLVNTSNKTKINNDVIFLDDNPENIKSTRLKKLWKSKIENFKFHYEDGIILAVGDPSSREKIVKKIEKLNLPKSIFLNLIHPSSIVSKNSKIGNGLIACPYTVICPEVSIGQHVNINISSSIGHNSQIGNFVTISGHCDIMGFSKLNNRVFMGGGSRIYPNVEVAEDTKISAGVSVSKNVKKKSILYLTEPKKLIF